MIPLCVKLTIWFWHDDLLNKGIAVLQRVSLPQYIYDQLHVYYHQNARNRLFREELFIKLQLRSRYEQSLVYGYILSFSLIEIYLLMNDNTKTSSLSNIHYQQHMSKIRKSYILYLLIKLLNENGITELLILNFLAFHINNNKRPCTFGFCRNKLLQRTHLFRRYMLQKQSPFLLVNLRSLS